MDICKSTEIESNIYYGSIETWKEMQRARLEKTQCQRKRDPRRQRYIQGRRAKGHRPSHHLTGLSLAPSLPPIWPMGKLRPRDGWD